MGNYVIGAGNYVIATPSEVGNYKIADNWNPFTAFQHLAAFSVVAGWVRDWRIDYYVAPTPDLNTQLTQMRKTV
jgi:hypothetical protein